MSSCPICGEPFDSRQLHEPGEGPNRSDTPVECFYHGQQMCTRVAEKGDEPDTEGSR